MESSTAADDVEQLHLGITRAQFAFRSLQQKPAHRDDFEDFVLRARCGHHSREARTGFV
jgi:hypothetical protein